MKNNKLFLKEAVNPEHSDWEQCIKRKDTLYSRQYDIRSEFDRDYNRILHCTAYRRLKHKTQVFFATAHDHVCTRIEHINHVASVSETISKFFGLNVELTRAVAIGHDLGHAPFGHEGEKIIQNLFSENKLQQSFWHEKNSLHIIDNLETLQDKNGNEKNLNLTYAVRDGIISHCGEIDEASLHPRKKAIDLQTIMEANQHPPFTWEGCVVKISDKISYLGRDIEDAVTLGVLDKSQIKKLYKIVKEIIKDTTNLKEINNTVLMHNFIIDLCNASSPEKGIRFSSEYQELVTSIKRYNNKNIYKHPRLDYFRKYAKLII
ncbi:MAG: HD domain-containing protein, partial [bacterium]|nr:HD domain-containing protein [bacterium]